MSECVDLLLTNEFIWRNLTKPENSREESIDAHVATQVAGAGPLTHARTMSSSRIIRTRLHAPQKWPTLLLLSESFGPNRFIPSEDATRKSDTSHSLVLWRSFQLMSFVRVGNE